jgi:hypothetical protein
LESLARQGAKLVTKEEKIVGSTAAVKRKPDQAQQTPKTDAPKTAATLRRSARITGGATKLFQKLKDSSQELGKNLGSFGVKTANLVSTVVSKGSPRSKKKAPQRGSSQESSEEVSLEPQPQQHQQQSPSKTILPPPSVASSPKIMSAKNVHVAADDDLFWREESIVELAKALHQDPSICHIPSPFLGVASAPDSNVVRSAQPGAEPTAGPHTTSEVSKGWAT